MVRAEGPGHRPCLLLLHGSPRVGGNTEVLLDEVARGAREAGASVEHLSCRKIEVNGCTGCGACNDSGVCAVRDGMDAVYRAVDGADALVVGAPVYFLGVPSQLKAVIDRFQCRWARRYVLARPLPPSRPGALVATAGAPSPSVFACPHRTVDAFFEVLGIAPRAPLLFENVDERGAIRRFPKALTAAHALGRALAAEALEGTQSRLMPRADPSLPQT